MPDPAVDSAAAACSAVAPAASVPSKACISCGSRNRGSGRRQAAGGGGGAPGWLTAARRASPARFLLCAGSYKPANRGAGSGGRRRRHVMQPGSSAGPVRHAGAHLEAGKSPAEQLRACCGARRSAAALVCFGRAHCSRACRSQKLTQGVGLKWHNECHACSPLSPGASGGGRRQAQRGGPGRHESQAASAQLLQVCKLLACLKGHGALN